MLILALICSAWLFSCAMAVALCVAARRGDERVAFAFVSTEVDADVAFVATFAEPALQPAPAARPAQRRSAV